MSLSARDRAGAFWPFSVPLLLTILVLPLAESDRAGAFWPFITVEGTAILCPSLVQQNPVVLEKKPIQSRAS